MSNKMKIKEEILVLDIGTPIQEGSPVLNPLMKIKSETAVCSDDEAEYKMEVKEDDLMPGNDSPKQEKPLISDPEMKIKSEAAVYSGFEMQNKTKVEESLALDIGLQNEESFLSHTMQIKSKSNVDGIISKIEITEEPWWENRTLIKDALKKPSSTVLGLQLISEIKDRTNEDFPVTEPTRLPTEAAPRTCSTTPYLLSSTADLEKKYSLKFAKENLQLPGLESSVIDLTFHCHKSKTPCDHKQSDKLNKCSTCSDKLHAFEICKKRFSEQKAGKRPFKCDICEKIFIQKGHLNTHILIHQEKTPFKCDVCGKYFRAKGSLNRHILIHQDKTPFKCDVCGKCFREKASLNKHILIHQGIKPFKCDLCGKCFRERGHLNRHILVHQGKKPFKCDVCGKCFREKGSLNKHILIHQGIKPFKCDLCGKSFRERGHLKTHILVHQGKKPFKCDVCGNCFREKRNLKKHILIH